MKTWKAKSRKARFWRHGFLGLLLCLAMLAGALSAAVLAEDEPSLSPDLEDLGDRLGPDQVDDWKRQDVPECDPEAAANCKHPMKYGIYTGRIYDPTCTEPGGIVIEWYCTECNTFMGESHLAQSGDAWKARHVLEALKNFNGEHSCTQGYRCTVCGQTFTSDTYTHKMVYDYKDEHYHYGHCVNPGCDYNEGYQLHYYGEKVVAKDNKCVYCGYRVDGNGVTGKVTPEPTNTVMPTVRPTPTPTAVPTATPHVHKWVYELHDGDTTHHYVRCAVPGCTENTAEPRQELHDFGNAVTATDKCIKCGLVVKPGGVQVTPTPSPVPTATPVPTAVPTPTPTLVPIASDATPGPVPQKPAKAVMPAAIPEVWKDVAEKLTFTEVEAVDVIADAPVSDVVVCQAEIHNEYDAYLALTVEWTAGDAQAAGEVLHMSVPVQIEAEDFKLVRVEEDGALTEVAYTYEDGVLRFDAEGSALYLLVPVE